jgi:hypothetical protein
LKIVEILNMEELVVIPTVRVPPHKECDSGMKLFDTVQDNRYNKCVISQGDKVETLDHFNWRMNEPTKPAENIIYTTSWSLIGVGIGCTVLSGIAAYSYKFSDLFYYALACVIFFILMIISGVLLLEFGDTSDDSGKKEYDSKHASWKLAEPAIF